MAAMTLDEVNALSPDAFVQRFGGVYEHSPWVAVGAVEHRPFASIEVLKATFASIVAAADEQQKRILVCAHPELGHRAGVDPALSRESTAEQGSAGLDRLTVEEYARFKALNAAYSEKFAMPFIICVRDANKTIIMEEMEKRIKSSPQLEILTALEHIDRIASLRLQDLVVA